MLVICFLFTCLSSGPVTSWPTFEPILGNLGVLGSTSNQTSAKLDEVYSIGQGAVLLFGIPMGMLYDLYGPTVVAFIGGLVSVIGLCSMAISIENPEYNWWLFWAYPLSVGGGGLASYSILGFVWLLPKNQTFVASLNGASLALSDSLALIGVYLVRKAVCSLSSFFYILAAMSAVSVVIIMLVAPSFQENKIHFFLATNNPSTYGGNSDENEVTDDDSSSNGNFCDAVSNVWKQLVKTKQVILLFPGAFILMQMNLSIFYFSAFYPTIVMYDYYNCIFDEKDAVSLVNLFPVVFGILGGIAGVASGYVCDKIGLVKYMQGYILLAITCAVFQVIPTYRSQVIWVLLWTIFASAFLPIYMGFAQRYAPYDIFGSFSGVMSTFMPIAQMAFGSPINQLMKRLYPYLDGCRRFTIPFNVLNTLAILSTLSIIYWWWKFPPPKQGSIIWGEDGSLIVLPQNDANKSKNDQHEEDEQPLETPVGEGEGFLWGNLEDRGSEISRTSSHNIDDMDRQSIISQSYVNDVNDVEVRSEVSWSEISSIKSVHEEISF